ncbi:MAG: glycosyltransferase family 4 protein [Minisyncoccia bacterium]|jgi:glycosyltransferase involved in cell wall biosynthesis
MTINFLLPHLKPSGGVSVSITFADELSKRGHIVVVAVESRSWTRYFKNLYNNHPLLSKNSKAKLIRVKSFADLPDADIFFADSWKVAKKLYGLSTKGAKFEYVQHDERMYHGDPKTVEEVYRLPLKKMVNATWLYKIFKEEFNEETEILFNAIDCNLFNPNKRDREPNDKYVKVLILHHDYKWKGTKEGVEIVQNLKRKYPELKLILFGTRQGKIDYFCDEYHYNVFGENLAKLFANSDIFLGPSIDDSRPLPHRWAMASGSALSIYDNVSTDDYVLNGTTALIAEKGNKENLSAKLEQLITDPDLRKKIAGNALEYVRQLPTWAELTDKLENIFRRAILNK